MKRSVLFVAGIVLAASAVSGSPVGETMALQARIDAATAAGGGEVRVPAGDHRIGGLPLRSGVTLHLEKDANITAFTPIIQKLMDELHPGCSLRYR